MTVRIRVGSYAYSPFWIAFTALAVVANLSTTALDRVRGRGPVR